MVKYESIVVFSVLNKSDEDVQALVEKFKALIEKNGTLESVSDKDWGLRKLAYPINDETEGYYVLFNFESEPTFPAELERIAGITEGVLRSIVVRK